jgi:CheY-like chemotaxis protein
MAAAQATPGIGRANLLIVDDDEALRSTLSEVFVQFGHRVRTAADGFAGLAEIRREGPDILLSDLHMPGMSGFEFLSVVRRRFPAIHVIAMSSAHAGAGLPAGVAADGYYEKASNLGLLLGLVTAGAQPERISERQAARGAGRHAGEPAPVWVAKNGHDPRGEAFVTLTCPECMRNFPQVLIEESREIHRAGCAHCSAELEFAVVQALEAEALVRDEFQAASICAVTVTKNKSSFS